MAAVTVTVDWTALLVAGPSLTVMEMVRTPDWAEAERQALAASLPPLQWRADASIEAGLKIVAQGNVVDGTLGALLGDRAEFEARLLRKMETST